MVVPQARWMVYYGKSIYKWMIWMIWGYSHDLGNLHFQYSWVLPSGKLTQLWTITIFNG